MRYVSAQSFVAILSLAPVAVGLAFFFSATACGPHLIGSNSLAGSSAITNGGGSGGSGGGSGGTTPSLPTLATITNPYIDGMAVGYSDQNAVTVSGTCVTAGGAVTLTYTDGTLSGTASPTCTAGPPNTWTVTLDLTAYAEGTLTFTANQAGGGAVTRTMSKRTAYCAVLGNRTQLLSASGTGASAGAAFRICTYTQLTAVPAAAAAGVFFSLEDNIDRASAATPALTTFSGNWQGNGHSLRNFPISTASRGLFNTVSSANISNLHLRNFSTTGASGLLAVSLSGTTLSTVSATGTVAGTASNTVGGIASASTGAGTVTFSGVWSAAAVTSGDGHIGGFLGQAGSNIVISDSRFSGTLNHSTAGQSNFNAGGFIGHSLTTNTFLITGSTSAGTITSHGTAGGFLGYADNANLTISTSVHSGSLTTYLEAGGFVGDVESSTLVLQDCANSGDITVTQDNGYIGVGAGGLVGYINTAASGSTITRCSNTGAISSQYNKVGGLIGGDDAVDANITDSYSTGNLTATTASAHGVGTIIGRVVAPAIINLTRTYGAGTMTAPANKGGLIGASTGTLTVTNSFWDQTTTGQAGSAGGGTALSTALMQTQATFDPPWNFTTTWQMPSTTGYPRLR